MYEKLMKKEAKMAVVGLGYVGIPLAIEFAKKLDVIGFDTNEKKIEKYKNGIDVTKEVGDAAVRETEIHFTSDESSLQEADFFIIAVPTPVREDKTPDLASIVSASEIVGRNMKYGAVVVYESTVYPGVTEEECVPVLEKKSGLKCGSDFKVGYSPERINPSDKKHSLSNVIKVVSGMDEETLDTVARVYELVARAGVHRTKSIRIAEAAKVIENSQRDLNIAFMNELSVIFHRMGIDTKAVLEAAGTKWNFLKFQPGLVGGHCIGVDPYYLTYKAEQLGYHSQVILAGRRINDDMGRYIVQNIVKALIGADKSVKNARVVLLGFTFKENCQDTRNTRVIDIIEELRGYGIEPIVSDDVADKAETKKLYKISLTPLNEVKDADVVAVCVGHDIFRKLKKEDVDKMYEGRIKLLFDIKGIFEREQYGEDEYLYWRL